MAKILVIEDDELARESIVLMLKEKGHEVLTAEDGHIGLDVFEKNQMYQKPIDMVLTDLIMPTISGMDVLSQIKNKQPDTKVVVISGGGRLTPLSYLDVAKRLGADDVLAKPFTLRALNTTIQSVLYSSPKHIN